MCYGVCPSDALAGPTFLVMCGVCSEVLKQRNNINRAIRARALFAKLRVLEVPLFFVVFFFRRFKFLFMFLHVRVQVELSTPFLAGFSPVLPFFDFFSSDTSPQSRDAASQDTHTTDDTGLV